MVGVGDKPVTRRVCVARAEVRMKPSTLAQIADGSLEKGDALLTALIWRWGRSCRTRYAVYRIPPRALLPERQYRLSRAGRRRCTRRRERATRSVGLRYPRPPRSRAQPPATSSGGWPACIAASAHSFQIDIAEGIRVRSGTHDSSHLLSSSRSVSNRLTAIAVKHVMTAITDRMIELWWISLVR